MSVPGRLRLAATVLREQVGPELHDGPTPYDTWGRLALADWLDASADFHEDKPHGYDCLGCGAESVADAILGTP